MFVSLLIQLILFYELVHIQTKFKIKILNKSS